VNDAGYGHITPKTATGRIATMIYATFGIPLTLLTIAHVGRYMAVVFRFIYKNLLCGFSAGVCTCCRRTTHHVSHDVTADHTDSDNESYSPTHNHLQVEGRDLGQGEAPGQKDEFSEVINRDGEAVELTISEGNEI